MNSSNNYKIISDSDFFEDINFDPNKNHSNIRLPKEMYPSKSDFEKEGFIFYETEEDNSVYETILPSGWKLEETEYFEWNNIFDETGLHRVSIYSSGSFYNKTSYMNLLTRYNVCSKTNNEKEETIYFGNNNEVLFIAGTIQNPQNNNSIDTNEFRNNLKQIAQQYGNEYYESWRNVHAYWEDNKNLNNNHINK